METLTSSQPKTIQFKDVEKEIIKRIDAFSAQTKEQFVVVLEGGHFSSKFGADEFTVQSQQSAFKIAQHVITNYAKKARVAFAVLADDLGQVCSADTNACTVDNDGPIKNDKQLEIPPELQEILQSNKLFKRDKLVFMSEKTARNRGIQSLRKYVKAHADDIASGKSHLKITEDEAGLRRLSFTAKDGQDIIVADMFDDWQWSSFCPLIMAQHYYDLQHKVHSIFSTAKHQLLIDFSFIDDRTKVNKGAELSLKTYPYATRVAIVNVCFGDDAGDMYTIDTHNL